MDGEARELREFQDRLFGLVDRNAFDLVEHGDCLLRSEKYTAPAGWSAAAACTMMLAMEKRLVAACLLFIGAAALAAETTVYVWTGPDGVTSYSQERPPAGQPFATREISTSTLTPAQRAAVQSQLARQGASAAADAGRFRSRVQRADQKIDAAVRRLADAEQALRHGREPQPGERIGLAGGGSRLRADYFDRQKALEQAVVDARAGLDEAYKDRLALTP
jgi:hypothetical protein